jgi:SAM-dependent MidA family methyltransferase
MHEAIDPSRVSVSDPLAIAHSDRLADLIRAEISQHGPIPFDRFMEMALYQPGLGYYTAGSHKLGEGGDFVTAPEISFLFSYAIARQCQQVLQQTGGDVLEFGAGSGIMAAHILQYLDQQQCLPERYLILDLSPDLQQRQRETIQKVVPDLLSRVEWLAEVPDGFTGVMLANEVLDAMPVSVFRKKNGSVEEQYVDSEGNEFVARWQAAGKPLMQVVTDIEKAVGSLPDGYVSELNARLDGWLALLAQRLKQGMVLLIDYGYSRAEYYHAQRSMGTLICHYQHRAHDDPFKLLGLQDITANVDFSAVRNAALKAGLSLAGYTPQANFLAAVGIEQLMMPFIEAQGAEFARMAQAVKVLMLPSEMGERFKVIALTRDFEDRLAGFAMRDFSDRL